MTERSASRRDQGVRRFLEDLRAGAERRAMPDRRGLPRHVGGHRAPVPGGGAGERRRRDRRALSDRRRTEFAGFTTRETEEIRLMLAHPDRLVACPRCGGNLLLTVPVGQEGRVVRSVLCTGCRGRLELMSPPPKDG